jgi:hypothetical protein
MRDFTTLETHDWQQIAAAANGQVSGTLAEWPSLQRAIDKTGIILPGDTSGRELKWCAEALYWQNRADEFATAAGSHAEAAHNQEIYTQELFQETERLKAENTSLREALKLESAYGARPGPPPAPDVLGGPNDGPE